MTEGHAGMEGGMWPSARPGGYCAAPPSLGEPPSEWNPPSA